MRMLRATLITMLLILPTLVTTAQATPNDGRYKTGSEGFKKQLQSDICATIHGNLLGHEADADKNAGTPAAAKSAKAADKDWQEGEAHGCSWAQ